MSEVQYTKSYDLAIGSGVYEAQDVLAAHYFVGLRQNIHNDIYDSDLDSWGGLSVHIVEWGKATKEDNCEEVFIYTKINTHTY